MAACQDEGLKRGRYRANPVSSRNLRFLDPESLGDALELLDIEQGGQALDISLVEFYGSAQENDIRLFDLASLDDVGVVLESA